MASTSARFAAETAFRNAQPSPDEAAAAIRELASDLPDDKKKQLANSLLFGIPPDGPTVNRLYWLVLGALVVILLAAAAVLIGIFTPTNTEVTMDRVLGIFTTVLSFIIGLFVPSPAGKAP